MNILELISNELKDKHFTKEEKLRYIYLRTCELFSFDSRYYYLNYYLDLTEEYLLNKHVDITNVVDYRTVCKPYCVDILGVLLCDLLELNSSIVKNYDHYYLVTSMGNNKYKLDATMFDLARVKMNLSTKGYEILGDCNYSLKDIDKEIGYIDSDYFSCKSKLYSSGINPIFKYDFKTFFEELSKLLNNSSNNRYYSDATYFINVYKDAYKHICNNKTNLDSMTFVYHNSNLAKLYKFYESGCFNYYLLSKKDKYMLEKISKEECKELVKSVI